MGSKLRSFDGSFLATRGQDVVSVGVKIEKCESRRFPLRTNSSLTKLARGCGEHVAVTAGRRRYLIWSTDGRPIVVGSPSSLERIAHVRRLI